MYKDLITYELAENVSREQLLSVARKVHDDWMKHQKGFVKWELNTNNDGSYTDIVFWESKEDAKKAEKEMGGMPVFAEWFACYKQGSISSKNLTAIADF